MNKIFEKHETLFCMLLIIIYIVVNSVCVQAFGYTSSVSFVVNTILSACLVGIVLSLKKVRLLRIYKSPKLKKYLYFTPLAVIISVNLWSGFNINNTASEITFHILTMINIGFIEELIFRGFLFRMMAKSNINSAIIVSAVTFGMGHIINLLNGAALIATLMQICYATATGYLLLYFTKANHLSPVS